MTTKAMPDDNPMIVNARYAGGVRGRYNFRPATLR